MKYKIYAFLEWFCLNEHSVAKLPELPVHKQLFWLHWIQWHLDFYLPGTDFCIEFLKDDGRLPRLLLLRKSDFTTEFLAKTWHRHFSIGYTRCTESGEDFERLKEHIIHDVEIKKESREKSQPEGVFFANISFRNRQFYCRYNLIFQALSAAGIPANKQPYPILVQRAYVTTLNDRHLVHLLEFDHYLDTWNAAAAE